MRFIYPISVRTLATILFPTLSLCLFVPRLQAQSTPLGSGTLTWTVTQSIGNCGAQGTFTLYRFNSFAFVYGNTTYPLNGTTAYYGPSNYPGCPGPEPPPIQIAMSTFGSSCTITFTSENYGAGSASLSSGCSFPSASGYINPKYIVMGVVYVAPGASSYTDYCNDTSVSSTQSILNSISSSYQESTQIEVSGSIGGWQLGDWKSTYSNKFSQQTSTGNSVTVSNSTSNCISYPGPSNNYVPNNHDYDIVRVWVNPLLMLTYMENPNNPNNPIAYMVWNGYGFNVLDQPAIDIQDIYVGCLNGDSAAMGTGFCTNNLAPLQRTWDTDETWPSGQGPALNSKDLANLLAADPFGTCTPSATLYPKNDCSITPNANRFTITDNENVLYQQPPVGGQPITTQYTLGYTTANTQSHGYTTSNETAFGIEHEWSGSIFHVGITLTFDTEQDYSTTSEADNSLTTTNGTTITASVTGPPCTVSGNACNPLYPSTSAPGPTNFDIYEDTLYGTFLYYPTNWYY